MTSSEQNSGPSTPPSEASPPLDEKQIEGELLQHPELLERLLQNPEIKAVVYRNEVFSGPLPSPNVLSGYEKVLVGSAERILMMAEKEQQHRHVMDMTALQGEINKDKRGQQFGLGIAVLFGVMALVLGLSGQPWLGGLIATVDLVALVAVFVMGRRSEE
ncbi:DUF2335 domain-containing protein [Zobellella iuensis]|uniref:DUF2335 domain-containing protein n=1 Tax=Zobellella iuensis TaxID=2803811 RepID=A0ABS1QS02_9GAMM|nr:DUF2335 domain-containing protein [Zobellella iuensis]MBL1377650.1 DUF2335 domain-containing protein [Zobellella iuensis]